MRCWPWGRSATRSHSPPWPSSSGPGIRCCRPSVAAGICLMGQNCSSHMGFLQKTLGFAEDHPGYQELLRGAASGLGAIGARGNEEAVTMLLDIGVPSQDPLRAPVALALGMVALRNTPVLLKVLEGRKDRDAAVSLIAEGFDMLEEDLEEERFFVTVRRRVLGGPRQVGGPGPVRTPHHQARFLTPPKPGARRQDTAYGLQVIRRRHRCGQRDRSTHQGPRALDLHPWRVVGDWFIRRAVQPRQGVARSGAGLQRRRRRAPS